MKEPLECFTRLPDGMTFGSAILDALGIPRELGVHEITLRVGSDRAGGNGPLAELRLTTLLPADRAEEIIRVLKEAGKVAPATVVVEPMIEVRAQP